MDQGVPRHSLLWLLSWKPCCSRASNHALVVVVVVVVVMPPHVPRLPYSGLVGVVSANWCEPWPTGWAFTSWN